MKNKNNLTKKLLTGLFCALVSGSGYASAMPTGAHNLQNISSITQNGGVMDIAGKGNAVAKWQDFSLKQGETVNFKGMNNVLNIVDGHKFSDVRGNINGQGVNVFLVNPSGVLFGDTSKVNVGSMTVSTQELSKNLAEEFVKNGSITTDSSKLGIGNVTFVGNVNANSIKATSNNISLVNTGALNVQNISLTTPSKGFINILKGQDASKLTVSGGTLRDDFEAVDSQDKLANLKSGGHYMLTKDIEVDGTWKGSKADKTEVYETGSTHWDDELDEEVKDIATRNIITDIIINGTGHQIKNMNGVGLFEHNAKVDGLDISNIIFSGETFTKDNDFGSAMVASDVERLKADNIISNYKTANSYGEGMFGDIRNGKVINIINNTSHENNDYTGNIANRAFNTDFENIVNNGEGYTGLAYYINGGDLKNSVNNGDVLESGFVKYYYNYYSPLFSRDVNERTYRDVAIINNVNNGNIGEKNQYAYGDIGGIAGYVSFENNSAVIDGNVNNGNIYAKGMGVGGIIGELYNTKNTPITLINNTNKGNIRGSYAAGMVGRWSGAGIDIENCTNYGKIYADDGTWQYMGGIIGELALYEEPNGDVSIKNVSNYGDIGENERQYGGTAFGGIIGIISGSAKNKTVTIDHAKNLGDLTGYYFGGGIIGWAGSLKSVNILNAYNKGDIKTFMQYNQSYSNGGIVGRLDVKDKSKIENVYNEGNIYNNRDWKKGNTLTGGIIGEIMGGGDVEISNAFNTGNISNADYMVGGLIGYNQNNKVTIKNAYNTGNIDATERDRTDKFYNIGSLVGYINPSASLEMNNIYNSGVVTGKDVNKGMIGYIDDKANVSMNNVYTTAENTAISSYTHETAALLTNNVGHVEAKKGSSFTGFDIDVNGSRPNATWRIYEGYTNPLLTVFMNDAALDNTSKTVTYTGSEQTYSKDDLTAKNSFGKANFFTEDIDYTKDSHVFDGKDGKEFEKVAGTEVGTYKTKIYSDQFGYNFRSTTNDETLTLTIEPAPEPTPTPAPTPEVIPVSPKAPVVNIGADKIVKINIVNQTGSYKDTDYEGHTLLNEKEESRSEQVDEKDIVEVAE